MVAELRFNGGSVMEKIEIKTETEDRLLKENEALRSCLESVSRYEKESHEFELKIAKDIVERDSKAVAKRNCN